MNAHSVFLLIFLSGAFCIFLYAARQRYWIKKLFLNSALGIALLIIVTNFGKYVYIECTVNAFSLAFSTVFGIPGAVFAIGLPIVQNL